LLESIKSNSTENPLSTNEKRTMSSQT
jgi:hypothetical protein